jgi:hypothetical protein
MTVYVADAHAHVQKVVLVVRMATVISECSIDEQHFVVRKLWAKELSAKNNHKEIFTMGSVYRVKWFSLGRKRFADNVKVETEMRNQNTSVVRV